VKKDSFGVDIPKDIYFGIQYDTILIVKVKSFPNEYLETVTSFNIRQVDFIFYPNAIILYDG